MLSRLAVDRPSGRPQTRTMALFLATLGFVVVALGALIAMVVFTPRQSTAAVDTASNARGVNAHTAYTNLLQESVRLNGQIEVLAKRNSQMIQQNLDAARATLSHASGIQADLDQIRPASQRAEGANLGIQVESGLIDGTNARIESTTRSILATSRAVQDDVRGNNVRNATVLDDSKAIAVHQAGVVRLQHVVLAHLRSIQCSPLVRACADVRGDGLLPTPVRAAPAGAGPRTAPAASAHAPAPLSSARALPRPTVSATPLPLTKRLSRDPLPILGAVEAGAGASGAAGALVGVVAAARRRRASRGRA